MEHHIRDHRAIRAMGPHLRFRAGHFLRAASTARHCPPRRMRCWLPIATQGGFQSTVRWTSERFHIWSRLRPPSGKPARRPPAPPARPAWIVIPGWRRSRREARNRSGAWLPQRRFRKKDALLEETPTPANTAMTGAETEEHTKALLLW